MTGTVPRPPFLLARQGPAVVVCAVPVAAVILAGVLFGPHLGSRIATHWSSGSGPNGFTATWPMFWGTAIATVLLAVAGACLVVLFRRVPQGRVWAAMAVFLAGAAASTWIVGAWATVAAGGPDHAVLGWRMSIIVGPLLCGAAVYAFLPATRPPLRHARPVPELELHDGDRLAWSGTTGSNLLLIIGVIAAAFFVVQLVFAIHLESGGMVIGVIVNFAVAILLLGMSRARLTVDTRGIRLASAVFGVPFIRVKLESIQSVAVEDIRPSQWGGWGYRVSSAGLAYVTRGGPGLVITRHSGTAIAITIRNPEQPAVVAKTLIHHH